MPQINPYFPNGEPNSPDVFPESLMLDSAFVEELLELPQGDEIWYAERFSLGVVSMEVGPLEFILVTRDDGKIRSIIGISPLELQTAILYALCDTMKEPSNTHPQRPKLIRVSQERHGKFINHLFHSSLNVKVEQAEDMSPVRQTRARLTLKETP